jgi:nucleotide-binding universal stress UspA family protein
MHFPASIPGRGTAPPPSARVVVTGSDAHEQPAATVVLGFDRDEVSRAALAVTVELARRLAAHVVVLHVVGPGDFPVDVEDPDWERKAQAALAEEQATVEAALAGHPYGFRYEARTGPPVENLVRVAEEVDALFVVVGRHGPGVSEGLRRLLEGSVSRRLLAAAARPVLVVPHS